MPGVIEKLLRKFWIATSASVGWLTEIQSDSGRKIMNDSGVSSSADSVTWLSCSTSRIEFGTCVPALIPSAISSTCALIS
jgi:hypothetical protein